MMAIKSGKKSLAPAVSEFHCVVANSFKLSKTLSTQCNTELSKVPMQIKSCL